MSKIRLRVLKSDGGILTKRNMRYHCRFFLKGLNFFFRNDIVNSYKKRQKTQIKIKNIMPNNLED